MRPRYPRDLQAQRRAVTQTARDRLRDERRRAHKAHAPRAAGES